VLFLGLWIYVKHVATVAAGGEDETEEDRQVEMSDGFAKRKTQFAGSAGPRAAPRRASGFANFTYGAARRASALFGVESRDSIGESYAGRSSEVAGASPMHTQKAKPKADE